VFLVNAVTVLGVFFVLWRWRREPHRATLPAERMASAVRAGIRYVRYTPALRAVIVRTAAFVLFASALWALLPLVAKTSLGRGPIAYGALVGSLGLGGLVGAAILPVWRRRQSTDTITAVATVVFAVGCLALAWVREFGLLLGAMLVAGIGWLIVVSSLILAAQRGAAEWVRGRALAVSTLTLFGSFAVGALLWGIVAAEAGIPSALMAAGGGLLLGLALIPLFPLAAAEGLKLDPAHIWDDPVVAEGSRPRRGRCWSPWNTRSSRGSALRSPPRCAVRCGRFASATAPCSGSCSWMRRTRTAVSSVIWSNRGRSTCGNTVARPNRTARWRMRSVRSTRAGSGSRISSPCRLPDPDQPRSLDGVSFADRLAG